VLYILYRACGRGPQSTEQRAGACIMHHAMRNAGLGIGARTARFQRRLAARRNSAVLPGLQVGPSQFPGVLVAKCHQPPGAIKNQKSTSNSVGSWVVRWVLSTPPRPPGHPAAGRCVCACRASTSLAALYSPCATSAFDWGQKPHSRSAPAPVGSSPGLVIWPVSALEFLLVGISTQLRPNRDP
jgi:hypothetical protein